MIICPNTGRKPWHCHCADCVANKLAVLPDVPVRPNLAAGFLRQRCMILDNSKPIKIEGQPGRAAHPIYFDQDVVEGRLAPNQQTQPFPPPTWPAGQPWVMQDESGRRWDTALCDRRHVKVMRALAGWWDGDVVLYRNLTMDMFRLYRRREGQPVDYYQASGIQILQAMGKMNFVHPSWQPVNDPALLQGARKVVFQRECTWELDSVVLYSKGKIDGPYQIEWRGTFYADVKYRDLALPL